MSLADLARGLRQAGGIISPEAHRTMSAEDESMRVENRQIEMAKLRHTLDEEAKKASPQYQMQQEQLKNEKLFREEVAGAGGDFSKIAGAAIKYGKPELAVNLFNQQESRLARTQQAQQEASQRVIELDFRLADKALDRESREKLQQRADETRNLIAKGNLEVARGMMEVRKLQLAMGNKADAPKAPSGYRWADKDQTVLEPIPGGPATVQSPEQAAKTELLANGIKDVERYRGLVLKDGKIDRKIIAGMATPGMSGIPGTDSRLAYSYIYNAIEAKLRAESGAAVPEMEVTRMAKRFVPSPLDNDETIRSKVDRLDEFLGGSLRRVKGQPGAGVPQGGQKNDADDPLGLR